MAAVGVGVLSLVPPAASAQAAATPTVAIPTATTQTTLAGLTATDATMDGYPPDEDPLDMWAGLGLDAGTFGAPAPAIPQGTLDRPTGVGDEVRSAVDADGSAAVIVRLHDQADLPGLQREAANAGQEAGEQARQARPVASDVAEAERIARATTVVDELTDIADRSQADVRAILDEQATDVTAYWIFNGFAATVDAETLATLEDHPDVASVTLDGELTLPEPIDDPGEPLLPGWPLDKVNAPDTWGEYGVRGEGVVVGIMDSGVDGGHPALEDSWRGKGGATDTSWFVATGENYPTPGDGHGHGTHVAGSIVGAPPGEVTGVAPAAEWIAAKIFRDTGSTTESIIHSSFEWMLNPGGDPAAAPHVVNNSWGADDSTITTFWDDVAAWVAAGIVPVFANGNTGPVPGSVGSPASFPDSIGVGATDINDLIAGFSSRGPAFWDGVEYIKPQVSAPGYQIRSTWPTHLSDDGYNTISGTSMASPHATGVVALMLSANPELTLDEVREHLEASTRTEPHMGVLPNNNYGTGIVDAFAAVTRVAYAGTLTGTITDEDGAPVAATIDAAGQTTTSDPDDGSYELSLAAGDHDVTVSAYGYVHHTESVTIVTGETTTVDVTLATAAEHQLTGTVAGPSGLLEGARVVVEGSPLPTAHTDGDGRFELTVAAGSRTLRVTAAGHAPARPSVELDGPTDLTIELDALDQPSDPGWSQYQNNPSRSGLGSDSLAAGTLEPSWSSDAGSNVVFASPVLAGGLALIGSDGGRLTAFDADTGAVEWVYDTGDALRGAPAVADGVVYTGGGVNGGIHALDAATGDELWSVGTPGRETVYTAPNVADGVVYAVTGPTSAQDDTVFALDAETGETLWSADVGSSVFGGPAVADGLVVVGNSAAELTALDATNGEIAWTLTRDADYFVSGPSLVDGTIYTTTTDGDGGGSLLAIDAATGQLTWENDRHGDGQGSTPATYGDLVIAGSHGQGAVVAYDAETGDEAWRYGISGVVSTSVLVSDDGYVVGGSQLDHRVWALDAATGELVWDEPVGANVTSSPAYADGRLVTADAGGTVHAFHPTGTVSGTVTGADGEGVPADVTIVESGTTVQADDEGRYEIDHIPGEVTVVATHFGLGQETAQVEIVAGRTVAVDFELAAVGDGAVTGVVTDDDGATLAGAIVALKGTPLDPATTGDDGAFGFDAVAAGEYWLEITLAGYAPLREQIEVVADETLQLELTLTSFDIGVIGDYEGRILAELTALGHSVEATDYADATARPGDFQVLVANGARDDPGAEALAAFLAATDDAGTSVVWLDTWSLGWGAIRHLINHTGDPSDAPGELSGSGRVSVEPTRPHPLTDGLPAGQRTQLLLPNSAWSSFTGYSGTTVAELHTDREGTAGSAIAYQPRGFESTHVLLGSLAAAGSWGHPENRWLPAARTVLGNAIDYATEARFGAVSGTITDEDGAPLTAAVEVPATGESTTADADGTYELLLAPGEHTVVFSLPGTVPVERTITIVAGESVTETVTLADSGLGTVVGAVTSAGSGPLAGAMVALAGTGLATTTGADGTYLLDGVPGGSYDLVVSADGHATSTVPIEVTAGEQTVADVELARSLRVAVLGDYAADGIETLLTAAEIEVELIDWVDVDRVGEFDVVVFNDPTDPGEQAFVGFLDALDEAGVSGVFPDDRFTGRGGARLLRAHMGDPAEHEFVTGEGIISYAALDDEHPLFAGLESPFEVLLAGSYAATLDSYSGIPLATLISEVGGERGAGAAYAARTPGSIHLLLGGLAATILQRPDRDWTDDGRALYLNAIRWAAAPGLGSVEGTVASPDGVPLPATITAADGQSVEAGADGSYVLPLAPGDYTLEVASFGYAPTSHEVTVTANQVTSLDVELAPAGDVGSVVGSVTSAGGPAVEGAQVALLGTPLATTTGGDGSWRLDLVEPGDYDLEVLAGDHVRVHVPITVSVGEELVVEVALRPTPLVGVIDDFQDRLAGYLSYWGYQPVELDWADTAEVAELDLVIANGASFSIPDPGADGWAAFADAVNRAGVPVLWLDQFGRGSFGLLGDHDGDPADRGQGRSTGPVTATVADAEHPIFAGLPETWELVEDGREHSWFDGFTGSTLATVASETGGGGGLVGVRGRGAGAVDVLAGTLSVSTYGYPGYRDEPGHRWQPETELLFRNLLDYTLDADGLAGEVRGVVADAAGSPVAASVTVAETGRVYAARDGDGSFVVPLPPGDWTLDVAALGYLPESVEVSVGAGDVLIENVTLAVAPSGAVSGVVTSDGDGPIADATVTIAGTPLTATTGADGGYALESVPAGDWTLEVAAAGYVTMMLPVTVADGETLTVDVAMTPSPPVAIVDVTGSSSFGAALDGLLSGAGYDVSLVSRAELEEFAGAVEDYELVIFNPAPLSAQVEAYGATIDAVEAASVSAIFAGQWGGYAIGALANHRGDPGTVEWGFVPDGVDVVASDVEHPLLAGLPAEFPLLENPGGNQQWLTFDDYSGVTVGHLHASGDGTDLGAAVAYRFSSPSSVEILLGGMAASTYAMPGDGWTPEAEQLYLNAVGWAVDARQAEVVGVVTGDGTPVGGAVVTAVESGASTNTAADGSYALGLAAGTHTISVEAAGFELFSASVEVPEDGSVTLDVDLVPLPRGSVAGSVTSVDGSPVADAALVGSGPVAWEVVTDSTGGYLVDDLLEGAYDVSVTAEGFVPTDASVTVIGDEVATLDVTLQPLDVGVLGDVGDELTDFLRSADVAAAPLEWSAVDPAGFEVIVVNGGSPSEEEFVGLLSAADAAEVSLVFTGTWGVDAGGIRLLERYTDRVEVGAQGFGDGAVELTGFDATHPLFAGLTDPATLIVEGGYYSVLESYVGESLADLSVDPDVRGPGVAFDQRTADSVEVLLSASAVTGVVGPGRGWTADGGALLVNAISWARDFTAPPPWDVTWEVDDGGPISVVRLVPDVPPGLPPADSATLVVRDASTGAEVRRVAMIWAGVFYLHVLVGLAPGDYELSAELEVDGTVFQIPGPLLP